MMHGLIPQPPLECGHRLIPKLVDEIAQTDPQRTYIAVPSSARIEDGFVDISFKVFARAVNRCAWWMESELGHSKVSKTVAYLGPLDYRYYVVLLAAAKTGHVAFLSSHRNSLEAHLSLLEATECQTMLRADKAPAIIEEILAGRPMQVLSVPETEFFTDDRNEVAVYPWEGSFEEVKDKPFVIIHSSGSTGIPKPVFVTHGTFSSNDAHQLIPSLGGNPTLVHFFQGKRFLVAFPPFHAANIYFTIGYNIFCGITCVLPPPEPPTVDVVDMIHTHGNLDGSLLPPSTIIDIYNNSEYLVNMTQKLQFVAYVGGTLSREVGDPISFKMKVITMMGSSEIGYLPVEIVENRADWSTIPISPFLGHEYRPSRDGLHELVIVRNPNLGPFQGVFSTFPNLDEYPMSDLYEPDPINPKAWVFRARGDDIICFSNAEKLNPVTMEAVISAHPAIEACLIGGHGEFQAALLVEPKVQVHTVEEKAKLLQEIWPVVMRANRDCPAHGRVMKDLIMFTKPGKPLPIAAKGTVQRYAALELYADEFKDFYAAQKNQSEPQPRVMSGQPAPANHPPKWIEPSLPVKDEPDPSKLSAMKPPLQSSILQSFHPAGIYTEDELDARIEKALLRILPDVLLQHLGPAFGRMAAELLQSSAVKSNQTHGIKINGRSHSFPDSLNPDGYDGPEAQVNGIGQDGHHNGQINLRDELYNAISNTTYLHGLTDTADFFDCGFDSLQVTALTNEINGFLPKLKPDAELMSKKFIYDNPSVKKLLEAMQNYLWPLKT